MEASTPLDVQESVVTAMRIPCNDATKFNCHNGGMTRSDSQVQISRVQHEIRTCGEMEEERRGWGRGGGPTAKEWRYHNLSNLK